MACSKRLDLSGCGLYIAENIPFPIPNLCEVSMTLLPSLITLVSASQRNLLVAGSIPVVGSSSNSIGGLPTRAIAVLSLRLLPPLYRR